MMTPKQLLATALLLLTGYSSFTQKTNQLETVKTSAGTLAGIPNKEGNVQLFLGVPFATPPVGALRWKAPQPAAKWEGVRRADHFGPRAMQLPLFGDMVFRSDGVSEDCLYLNVWTPARSGSERLPVMVYFYGGGFVAGDGSEPRYDGQSMAKKGIVAITVNYRLGIFGFFTHPELTRESPHHASGNYGLLDQNAALQWVKENIAAFGGDPGKVTIAGESAGSFSVSAQMASPLSKGLIAGAIGESGSLLSLRPVAPLAQSVENGVKFASAAGANDLAALRAMPATQLLEASTKPGTPGFSVVVDGYFFPESPVSIFTAGKQAHVPLLAGWNSEESGYRSLLGQEKATPEGYATAVQKVYGERAADILKLYPGTTEAQIIPSATDLAGDRFIGFSTWKWLDLHSRTGGKPVYRYLYSRPRPMLAAVPDTGSKGAAPAMAHGAVHSAEIEYALGNLGTNKVYAWTPEDHQVSAVMQNYFANFIKNGDPNGKGLPPWPAVSQGAGGRIMHIDVQTRAEAEPHRERYLYLDQLLAK